jgi:hypothetical protein
MFLGKRNIFGVLGKKNIFLGKRTIRFRQKKIISYNNSYSTVKFTTHAFAAKNCAGHLPGAIILHFHHCHHCPILHGHRRLLLLNTCPSCADDCGQKYVWERSGLYHTDINITI